MRILMVTDFYHPFLGGVEQHVRTLGHHLADIGHDVTVATLAAADLPTESDDGAVRVLRLPSTTARLGRLFSQPRTWAPPVLDPETSRALGRVVRRVDPDVIHGHDWMARSLFPRRLDAPYVSSLHYYTRSCSRKDLMQGDRRCAGPRLRACLSCASDHYGRVKGAVTVAGLAAGSRLEDAAAAAFIAVSRATATGNGLDPEAENVFVIPNFLPAASPADRIESASLLARLPEGPFALYVGDFRAIKGFDLLLAAYERCSTDLPLVVIGKRWPETPSSVPDGVHVFEQWPNEAVRAAFGRAAFAVVPSMWEEPFGIVAIEALAEGTPVVAADVGGLGEIVTDVDSRAGIPATGITFRCGDVNELAASIDRLSSDPDLRRRLGDNARQAAQRYTAESVVPRIVDVYQEVLG